MENSILSGKTVLAVDDEPDVLAIMEEEISVKCPACRFEKAATFDEATQRLASFTYDLMVLDIMGVRGFDLLERAVFKKIPVAMLTAHALTPEALKKSFDMGARAYLPKEKLGEIVPYLEDVLVYEYLPGWKRLLEKMKGFFDRKFGKEWEEKVNFKWRQWD